MELVLEREERLAPRDAAVPDRATPDGDAGAASRATRAAHLEDLPDAELVSACLGGRKEGFTVLTRRYGPTILAFAFSRLGDRDRAEEVAQESLVRAFERLWSLRAPRAFAAWRMGIANNVILQEIGRRSRSVPLEDIDEVARGGTPAEKTSADETRNKLLGEVNALPGHYRLVMMLKYQENMTCEEISARLHVSVGTIRSRLSRAYALLRKALSDYEEML